MTLHTDRGPARLREHRVVERLGAHDLGDVAAPGTIATGGGRNCW